MKKTKIHDQEHGENLGKYLWYNGYHRRKLTLQCKQKIKTKVFKFYELLLESYESNYYPTCYR